MAVLVTGQRHNFTSAPCASGVISEQFWPLKPAGAVMDIPEARKQGYRGRYVCHVFLPSSHQKWCVSPPAAGECRVSGLEPFVHQVSTPQQGPFPRGAGHAAQSKAYVNRDSDHMSPGTDVWDQKLPYQWKKKATCSPASTGHPSTVT